MNESVKLFKNIKYLINQFNVNKKKILRNLRALTLLGSNQALQYAASATQKSPFGNFSAPPILYYNYRYIPI